MHTPLLKRPSAALVLLASLLGWPVLPPLAAADSPPFRLSAGDSNGREAAKSAALAETRSDGSAVLECQPVFANEAAVAWAVVLGKTRQPEPGEFPVTQIRNVRLRLYAEAEGKYRNVSGALPLRDPRFPNDPATSVALACTDLNEDGTDEVLVTQTYPGASWQPGCAFVFKLAEGRALVHVGTITSHYPIRATSAGVTGRPVIPATYAIGQTLPHSEQPRWTDYYGFDGKALFLANRFAPEHFRNWPDNLMRLLQEHPDDAELWFFLARAYQALGEPQESAKVLAKANSFEYRQPDWKKLRAGLQLPALPDSAGGPAAK
ncbi:MAG: tetratricopeptide repeat protein [Verrucomicrobiia bacterium]